MSRYLAVDVGASYLRASVASENLDVLGRGVERTPQGSSGETISDVLLRVVEKACDVAEIDPDAVDSVAIGSIGPLDQDAGAIVDPANVSGDASQIPLVRPLRTLLSTDQIVLLNDTTAGVIGEKYYTDRASENMVYLTISTGIGAGIVVDGTVLSGHRGNVGEVGHLTIDPAGTMTCRCGGGGHWEAYCSGANIPRYAAKLHREGVAETELPVDDDGFTAADVFDAVGEDELADRLVERIARWNVIGVSNVVQAFTPSYIAVGGAVALNNGEAIVGPIRRRVSEHVMIDTPEIELTELGDEVVLKGALISAQRLSSERSQDVIPEDR